jgi:hypothetical protein
MRIKILLFLVLVCSVAAQGQIRSSKRVSALQQNVNSDSKAAAANTLPIKRVIIYSNGVAYIERRGFVSGDAEVNLSFKQSQVDDVLKSMVVLDLGQGRIGAVSYNSSAPPSAKMAEIPFSVDAVTDGANGGLAGVLAQLQGAKVSVATTGATAIGSILTVEKRDIPAEKDKPARAARFLVIAGENGEISSFDLSEVRSVKLLENGTVKDVKEFANATALARRRDAKTITVTSDGSGQREMIVSYIVAAPIWKTTYRVIMDEQGKPFFQGWAIVDNVSDEDWRDVQLSLVSGTPISFIQPIQQPFFRYRPVVPIPDDLKLTPQIYEPDNEISGYGTGSGNGNGRGTADTTKNEISKDISQRQINNLPMNGRNTQSLIQLQSGLANNVMVEGARKTTISNAITTGNSGVETAATGDEIGDLFEYKIAQPVTVMRDRSALIPIVQTTMDGERVSIYNEAVRRDRPMGGMKLVNTTALTLEGGSLTVLDGNAYAGEALMERLKPKEQRFISYALDLGTLVTVRQETDGSTPAKLIKIVNGTFEVHYFRQERKTYTLQNQTERPRVVYIESPVRQGWLLADDALKPDITTQRYYRYKVELPAYEKREITISEQQALMDSYALTNLSRADLELFLSRRYINAETKLRLEKLIDLRVQINRIDAKLQAFEDEEEKISEDQKRLRENIEALSKTPEARTLIARYIAKANDQETRLEAIVNERKTLEAEKQRLEVELSNAIRAFNI